VLRSEDPEASAEESAVESAGSAEATPAGPTAMAVHSPTEAASVAMCWKVFFGRITDSDP
jgi:hypothetical protein